MNEILNFILNNKKKKYIADIEIEAIFEENIKSDTTITKHPVEKGADITDHIIINPKSFNLNGAITANSRSLYNQGTIKSPLESWNLLLDAQAKRLKFDIVLGEKVYKNIVIKSIEKTKTAETGNDLYFTAQLEEIIKGVLQDEVVADSKVADDMSLTMHKGLK